MECRIIRNEDELYHYGVLGMKWGHRKSVTSGPINGSTKNTKRKSGQPIRDKDIDTYLESTKRNSKLRNSGYAMAIAGTAMKQIGKNQYNIYKNGSTPARTAVINGLGYGGSALQAIGTMAVGGSMIKQYADYKKYW